MSLVTEFKSVIKKKNEINEDVRISGMKDIKETFPEVYKLLKEVLPEDNKSVEFVKTGVEAVIKINPFLVAKKDKMWAIDIQKLADFEAKMKENEKVKDVYINEGCFLVIELNEE